MSFDLYFAGANNSATDDYFISNNCNRLFSQLNDRKLIQRYVQAKKDGWTGKLMIDSGAFTLHRSDKKVDVDKYIDYLNEYHDYFDYYIQLDHIPGKWGQPRTAEQ